MILYQLLIFSPVIALPIRIHNQTLNNFKGAIYYQKGATLVQASAEVNFPTEASESLERPKFKEGYDRNLIVNSTELEISIGINVGILEGTSFHIVKDGSGYFLHTEVWWLFHKARIIAQRTIEKEFAAMVIKAQQSIKKITNGVVVSLEEPIKEEIRKRDSTFTQYASIVDEYNGQDSGVRMGSDLSAAENAVIEKRLALARKTLGIAPKIRFLE